MRKKESFGIGIIFLVICSLLLVVGVLADDWNFLQIGSLKPGDAHRQSLWHLLVKLGDKLMDKQGNEVVIKSIEQVKDKKGITV